MYATALTEDHGVRAATVRILIAGEQPLLLDGLQAMLATQADFEVVGRCADDDEEIVGCLRDAEPDVAVLDVDLVRGDRLRIVRRINDERLAARLVLMTALSQDDALIDAVRLGVRGVFVKSMPSRLITECIRRVHAGDYWLEKRMTAAALQKMVRREAAQRHMAHAGLSAREIEIARLAGQGLQNLGIGTKLHISPATVKIHLHKVYQKLGLSGRIALMVYARENDLA